MERIQQIVNQQVKLKIEAKEFTNDESESQGTIVKTLGLRLQEMMMINHAVMRKAIDPPTDHNSDQELDKGRDTQVITYRTMM